MGFDTGSMSNPYFGRCDGHHKKVDCTPKPRACVKSFTYTRSAGAHLPTRSRQKGNSDAQDQLRYCRSGVHPDRRRWRVGRLDDRPRQGCKCRKLPRRDSGERWPLHHAAGQLEAASFCLSLGRLAGYGDLWIRVVPPATFLRHPALRLESPYARYSAATSNVD